MSDLENLVSRKFSNYLEFRRPKSQDVKAPFGIDVFKRMNMLAEGKKIKHNEVPASTYLKRLSKDEQNNIVYLADLFSRGEFQSYHCFSPAFIAVGTTTYPEKYWKKLSKSLIQDATKHQYLERRGEDIDIRLVDETGADYEHTIKRMKSLFDNHNVQYTYSTECEWGAHYFWVPEKHIEQAGEKITRTKGEEYASPNFVINFEKGRKFHLYIGPTHSEGSAREQIMYEKAKNLYFSVLTRSLNRDMLKDNIRKANVPILKRFFEDIYVNIKTVSKIIPYEAKNVLKSLVINKKEIKDKHDEYERHSEELPF